MLTFHREFHPKIVQEFSIITDNELELPSTFWEETRFPIRHRLHRYEAHFVQHTVQIDKTLVSIGQAPSETKRLIRYLFAALAEVEANLIGENNFTRRLSATGKRNRNQDNGNSGNPSPISKQKRADRRCSFNYFTFLYVVSVTLRMLRGCSVL